MSDRLTIEQRHNNMAAIRSKDAERRYLLSSIVNIFIYRCPASIAPLSLQSHLSQFP